MSDVLDGGEDELMAEAAGEQNPEEECGTDDECIVPSPVLVPGASSRWAACS